MVNKASTPAPAMKALAKQEVTDVPSDGGHTAVRIIPSRNRDE
jgi:hypothetical protein